MKNSLLASIGNRYFQSSSLVGNLRRLTTLLIVTVIVTGIIPISLYSYRVSKTERAQSIQAIGTTLARLAARSLSLGDFLSVEESLQGTTLPEFVCRIEVRNRVDSAVAAITNLAASSRCREAGSKSQDWTFPVSRLGELDQTGADAVIARVHLRIDDRDL